MATYPYANPLAPQSQTAIDVQTFKQMPREPSIPEKIAETHARLVDAHAILDRLEGIGQGPSEPAPESLVGATAMVCQLSAALVGRLRTLFGPHDYA